MKEENARSRPLKKAERLALISRLKENYDAIAGSYEYPLCDQISALEESRYSRRHHVTVDGEGRSDTYFLFFTSPEETWEGLCGVEGVNVVDAETLKAIRFDLRLMS